MAARLPGILDMIPVIIPLMYWAISSPMMKAAMILVIIFCVLGSIQSDGEGSDDQFP
jgi:hypothetical protein